MVTSELIQKIKTTELYPIPVEGWPERDETSALFFSGSLEGFFEAAKALGATAVFLFVETLEEEDFLYDLNVRNENGVDDLSEEETASDEPAGDEESVDLTIALPSLADFRKHIGQECRFLLTAKSQVSALNLYLPESWWISFDQQRDKAIQKVDEDQEVIREKMEAQRLQKDESLLAKTRSLLDDPEFCRIPTQRGMRVYALEKLPDLESVDDSRLTEAIRKLSDKVKARTKR